MRRKIKNNLIYIICLILAFLALNFTLKKFIYDGFYEELQDVISKVVEFRNEHEKNYRIDSDSIFDAKMKHNDKNDDENDTSVLVGLESLLENIEHNEDYVRDFVHKFPLTDDPKEAINNFNIDFIRRSRFVAIQIIEKQNLNFNLIFITFNIKDT